MNVQLNSTSKNKTPAAVASVLVAKRNRRTPSKFKDFILGAKSKGQSTQVQQSGKHRAKLKKPVAGSIRKQAIAKRKPVRPSRRCLFQGCTMSGNYGYKNDAKKFCFAHKQKGMVHSQFLKGYRLRNAENFQRCGKQSCPNQEAINKAAIESKIEEVKHIEFKEEEQQDALGWFERCTDFEPENTSEIQVEQPSELQSGEDIETLYHHNQQAKCWQINCLDIGMFYYPGHNEHQLYCSKHKLEGMVYTPKKQDNPSNYVSSNQNNTPHSPASIVQMFIAEATDELTNFASFSETILSASMNMPVEVTDTTLHYHNTEVLKIQDPAYQAWTNSDDFSETLQQQLVNKSFEVTNNLNYHNTQDCNQQDQIFQVLAKTEDFSETLQQQEMNAPLAVTDTPPHPNTQDLNVHDQETAHKQNELEEFLFITGLTYHTSYFRDELNISRIEDFKTLGPDQWDAMLLRLTRVPFKRLRRYLESIQEPSSTDISKSSKNLEADTEHLSNVLPNTFQEVPMQIEIKEDQQKQAAATPCEDLKGMQPRTSQEEEHQMQLAIALSIASSEITSQVPMQIEVERAQRRETAAPSVVGNGMPAQISLDKHQMQLAIDGSEVTSQDVNIQQQATATASTLRLKETAARLNVQEETSCVICMDNMRTFLLLPCKHICLCTECFHKLNVSLCPICRSAVITGIKVYF